MECRVNKRLVLFLIVCLLLGGAAHASEKESEAKAIPLIPVIFQTEETGLGFGALYMKALENGDGRPGSMQMLGYYTTRDQYLLSLAPELVLAEGRYQLSAYLDTSYTPSTLWGVGYEAGAHGRSEEYTYRGEMMQLTLLRKLTAAFFLGPQFLSQPRPSKIRRRGACLMVECFRELTGGRMSGSGWSGSSIPATAPSGRLPGIWHEVQLAGIVVGWDQISPIPLTVLI